VHADHRVEVVLARLEEHRVTQDAGVVDMTSSLPNASTAWSTRFFAPLKSDTSSSWPAASPPRRDDAPTSSAATCRPFTGSASAKVVHNDLRAVLCEQDRLAAPHPSATPVTMATLPSSRPM